MRPRGRDRRVPGHQPQFQPASVGCGQQRRAASDLTLGHTLGEPQPEPQSESVSGTKFQRGRAAGHLNPALQQGSGAAYEAAILPFGLTVGESDLTAGQRHRLADNVPSHVGQPVGIVLPVLPKLEVLEITQGGLAQCEI